MLLSMLWFLPDPTIVGSRGLLCAGSGVDAVFDTAEDRQYQPPPLLPLHELSRSSSSQRAVRSLEPVDSLLLGSEGFEHAFLHIVGIYLPHGLSVTVVDLG